MNTSDGPGRRPIPADLYLDRWSPVVESLKAGLSTREIYAKHGTCAETVRHIRRCMVARGMTIPKRERPITVKPKPEPKPRKPRATGADLVLKYPVLANALRKGKRMNQAAALAGVSLNTTKVVKRALVAQGELP